MFPVRVDNGYNYPSRAKPLEPTINKTGMSQVCAIRKARKAQNLGRYEKLTKSFRTSTSYLVNCISSDITSKVWI